VEWCIGNNPKSVGIRIKPVTAPSGFGNYTVLQRMTASFESFQNGFGGHEFIAFNLREEVANKQVIDQIKTGLGGLK